MTPARLVVIGNGMAGSRLVEDVLARRGARPVDITVFGDEPGGAYNRILLSGVLAGTHRADDIVTHPVGWYRDNGVTLLAHVRAERVDVTERCVEADDGRRVPFDVLVFATGGQPILPPIEGLEIGPGGLKPGAFVFRTLQDCHVIGEAAQPGRRAVVIGGGLLGLEAARGVAKRGVDVTVIHLTPHIMDAQLDPAASQLLQRQLEILGVRILAGQTTTAVLGDERVEAVRLADGRELPCDLAIVTAGVRPNAALAAASGLAVRRGILVDDELACCGHAHVYAIGDCAEHRGRTHGLVAPAWEQASVLADRLTGRRPDARYTGSSVTTKLKIADVDVAVMGEKEANDDDDVVVYAEMSRGVYQKLIVRDNRLAGAILIGAGPAVPAVTQAFIDGVPLPERRSDLLFPQLVDAVPTSVEQMPDHARICDCNAVSKAQLVEAVLAGATSLRSVCERTRAGTGCGSCRPEVQRVIDFAHRNLDAPAALSSSTSDALEGLSHAG